MTPDEPQYDDRDEPVAPKWYSRGGPVRGVVTVGSWPPRRWAVALAVAVLMGLVIGVPTRILPNPLFTRMTPVTWWDYPVWAISALLVGLLAATYVRVKAPRQPSAEKSKRTFGAMLLSGFAVGCPICNKLVVGLIGVSGALNYWAPLQPLLGVLSLGLLSAGLALRLRGAVACPTPTGA